MNNENHSHSQHPAGKLVSGVPTALTEAEELRRTIGAFVCNVSNLPVPLQVPALGLDMSPLIDGLTDRILAARVSTATGDEEELLDAAVEREEDAEARTALAEKWLGASKAARAFEHHWPADCLAEAAHMLLSTATGVTAGDDLRESAREAWREVERLREQLAEANDSCPTPGYAGRHIAVGAGAVSSPYRCHGCGTWFTLPEDTATGDTEWDCDNFTEPATCLSAGVTVTARCGRCRLRLMLAEETVRLATGVTAGDDLRDRVAALTPMVLDEWPMNGEWLNRSDVLDALTASSAPVVSRPEAEDERRFRDEWADYFEHWTQAVGPDPLTVETVIAVLRARYKPFGIAAASLTADPEAP